MSATLTPFNSRYPVTSWTCSKNEKLLAVSCALVESGVAGTVLRSMAMLPSMVVHPHSDCWRVCRASKEDVGKRAGWTTHKAGE